MDEACECHSSRLSKHIGQTRRREHFAEDGVLWANIGVTFQRALFFSKQPLRLVIFSAKT